MSRLESMRVFLRVATLGSFAGAAREMGTSPASVSLHVRALEEELGVRLLNRTTRRTSMTEEGRVFFDHCLRVTEDIAAVEERLRGAAGAQGTLRVDLPVVLCRLLLLPALPRFLADHPGLRLQVTMDNRDVDLAARELDCAVRIEALPDSSLVARPLGRMRWVTCAAPAYLAAHGAPSRPDDLARHRCLVWLQRPARKPMDWQFADGGRPLALAVQGELSCDSLDPLVEAARAGLGLVQAPDFALRGLCARGELRPVLAGYETDGPPLWLVYPHRRHVPGKVKAFGDFLARLLADKVDEC